MCVATRVNQYLRDMKGIRGSTRRVLRWGLQPLIDGWREEDGWVKHLESAENVALKRGWGTGSIGQAKRMWQSFGRWHDRRFGTEWEWGRDKAFVKLWEDWETRRWTMSVKQRQHLVMGICLSDGWKVEHVRTARLWEGAWPLGGKRSRHVLQFWMQLREMISLDLSLQRRLRLDERWVKSELLFPGPYGREMSATTVRRTRMVL